MKTIDATPTWTEVLPLLLEVAVNGDTLASRKAAKDQLRVMAHLADEYNAARKALQSLKR